MNTNQPATFASRTDSNWIQVFTGRQFWPTNPRPEDVDIRDIAHALSLTCRFTGHTEAFYSVAQHSVLISQHCGDPRWGLLHDAAEAYLPDVARPVKQELTGFSDIEDRLLGVIASVFGLTMPIPQSVHVADLVLLATEARDLMVAPSCPWNSIAGISPLGDKIVPWEPHEAESAFLHRFDELFRHEAINEGDQS
jgi:hypothetical protein